MRPSVLIDGRIFPALYGGGFPPPYNAYFVSPDRNGQIPVRFAEYLLMLKTLSKRGYLMENKYVLKMEGITKEYFGNKVLKGVELKVRPGEIHALMGENGAGKSTLMNILFGMPVIHSTVGFEGQILMDGEAIEIKTPRDAMKYGIGMVHQHFRLIDVFTVLDNIILGSEPSKFGFLTRKNARKNTCR